MSFSDTIVSFSLGSCSTIVGTQITSILWLPPKCKKYSTPVQRAFLCGMEVHLWLFWGGRYYGKYARIYRCSRYPPSINPKISHWLLLLLYYPHVWLVWWIFEQKNSWNLNHRYLQSVGKTVRDALTEFQCFDLPNHNSTVRRCVYFLSYTSKQRYVSHTWL